jgi:hypothetical protein
MEAYGLQVLEHLCANLDRDDNGQAGIAEVLEYHEVREGGLWLRDAPELLAGTERDWWEWTPAGHRDLPALPLPFTAAELAAFMLYGRGLDLYDRFADDDTRMEALAKRSPKAHKAMTQALALRHEADSLHVSAPMRPRRDADLRASATWLLQQARQERSRDDAGGQSSAAAPLKGVPSRTSGVARRDGPLSGLEISPNEARRIIELGELERQLRAAGITPAVLRELDEEQARMQAIEATAIIHAGQRKHYLELEADAEWERIRVREEHEASKRGKAAEQLGVADAAPEHQDAQPANAQAPAVFQQRTEKTTQVAPVGRQQAQEQTILNTLHGLGYTPRAMPKSEAYKPGVKSEVRAAIGSEGMWHSPRVFDKAWERLRERGEIADKP